MKKIEMDENGPFFEPESDRPLPAGWDRAKRLVLRGARAVALAAFALCAAIGAAALLSVWHFAADRPLLRELYCLTPEAFDRPAGALGVETAPGAETDTAGARLRPVPEIRLVLVDRGGQELLLCAAADRLGETPGLAVPPDGRPLDGLPPIRTTLFARLPERAGAAVR